MVYKSSTKSTSVFNRQISIFFKIIAMFLSYYHNFHKSHAFTKSYLWRSPLTPVTMTQPIQFIIL